MSTRPASTDHRRSVLLTIAVIVIALLVGTVSPALALPGDDVDVPDLPELPDEPWPVPDEGFDWWVPERFTERFQDRYDWHWDQAAQRYDDDYVRPSQWRVYVNGCRTETDGASPFATQYTYTFITPEASPVRGNACVRSLSFPSEGTYEVRMTVHDAEGVLVGDYTHMVEVKDILVVVLGDSYASGEGNPEYPLYGEWGDGGWVDDRCHRSSHAGAAQAARQLERSDRRSSVTFISFACSGATIDVESFKDADVGNPYRPGPEDKRVGSGVLGPYTGAYPFTEHVGDKIPSQLDQLRAALALDTPAASGTRQVDALVMSAGGNDAGFGLLATACGWHADCTDPGHAFTGLDGTTVTLAGRVAQDLAALPGRYKALSDGLAALPNLVVADTFVTEYPDPGTERDADGNVVQCQEILEDVLWLAGAKVDKAELTFARSTFLPGLNNAVRDAAAAHDWHFVGGISDDFAGHGYCVGANDQVEPERYIRTAAIAEITQGPNPFGRTRTTGTLHPNGRGQRVYRDRILAHVGPRVAALGPDGDVVHRLDRTPPSVAATVTPAANAAGWHDGPVTVQLVASTGGANALSHVDHRLDGGAWHRTDGDTVSVAIPDDGIHTVEYRATDTAYNVGEVESAAVRIDSVDPAISVTTPDTGPYLLGEAIVADYTCDDDRSGMAACVGTIADGAVLDTTVGSHTFQVEATDVAGNRAHTSLTYQATYGVCPMFEQHGSFKAGRTVPIRVRLCDAAGANVSSPTTSVVALSLVKVDDAAATTMIEDAGNANPDGNFRYDVDLAGYVHNLSTKGLSSGTWRLEFRVSGDDLLHHVTFDVR